jgi:hypothetical protein
MDEHMRYSIASADMKNYKYFDKQTNAHYVHDTGVLHIIKTVTEDGQFLDFKAFFHLASSLQRYSTLKLLILATLLVPKRSLDNHYIFCVIIIAPGLYYLPM